MSTRVLLRRYCRLVIRHGPGSVQARRFVDRHRANDEFAGLARLSAWLWVELRGRE